MPTGINDFKRGLDKLMEKRSMVASHNATPEAVCLDASSGGGVIVAGENIAFIPISVHSRSILMATF